MMESVDLHATPALDRGTIISLDLEIEILEDPQAEPSAPVSATDAPRPTLARAQPGATGLFQGWGPRIR